MDDFHSSEPMASNSTVIKLQKVHEWPEPLGTREEKLVAEGLPTLHAKHAFRESICEQMTMAELRHRFYKAPLTYCPPPILISSFD
jgi:hypothetical protein